MPLLPGELIHTRYRIVELLGQGDYGAVYRARDIHDAQDVVLKEYRNANPAVEPAFREHARQWSRLSHPQLPQLLDFFIIESSGLYLVNQYIDGVSLHKILQDYGPLPSDLIIGWLQAATVPLTYLHSQNIVHLDIKPANIRITPTGDVFLVDTGWAEMGIHVGNKGFAPPEQQKQTAVNAAADIYQLGATLFNLLTGDLPPDALRRETLLEDLKAARELNPDVEPYLSVTAARALDLRPDVRFETAGDFAKALERPAGRPSIQISSGRRTPEQAQAAPPILRRFGRTWRQIETRTLIASLFILLAFFGVGLGIAFFNRTQPLGGSTLSATATTQSQIISALTQIAPSATPTSPPTATPPPTPAPLVDEKTGMVQRYMPSGPFRMGSDKGRPNEEPSHLVRIDAYYIDETEVTNSQYLRCVEEAICRQPENLNGTYHPAYFGDSEFADYPVIFVNWFDAQQFCEWRGARLPSEAEWEKAAAFDPTQFLRYTYPWGDQWDGQKTNYCDVNCPDDAKETIFDDGHLDTAPVKSYNNGRSPIGVYDMSGNVLEWIADWYDLRYYANAPMSNPLGPLDGESKVIRGGSWLSESDEVTTSWRSSFDPTVTRANVGFRCAMPAP